MECKWLKNHISMDTSGALRPCCNFRIENNSITVKEIRNYRSSQWLTSIETQLENNQWPKGCIDCQFEEENNVESLRLESFNKYKNNKTDAEVKFGNLCNLACMMCSPANSSLINNEIKELQKTETHEFIQKRRTYQTLNKWYENSKLLEEVAEFLSDRDQIRFTGGEPTVNNYLSKFLDALIRNNSKCEIRLTTNGNNWPNDLHEKLSNFKLKVDVSIDAYGKINDYIRWPSRWSKIEKNIKKINSISDQTSCYTTVACYNVHTLSDLCKWTQQNFHAHILNTVITPKFMNPSNCNEYSKNIFQELAEWYEPAKKILPIILKPGNTDCLDSVYKYFLILDKKRKTNVEILGTEWNKI